MRDIARWLADLDLEKYAAAFEASEIDAKSLPLLTDADLAEIGLPLGPRRKLLAAIAKLGPPANGASAALSPASGERRHITVLFADIVGSTELSARLDPEILSELLCQYQNVVSAQLRDFGGHLAKFMGDGVLAYFGWPQASEDAAENSLRASLGIVAAVSNIVTPDGAPLQVRIGIASGVVVVGGLVGTGAAQEEAVAGDTLNLAARLQTLAAPNAVIISQSTHQLVGGLFDCEAQGEHALKGFAQSVSVWRVAGENPNANRFKSVRGKHAGFFGRKPELELLCARWDEASAGNGYAAILLGEAGIGKSRLVCMLQERIAGGPHREISWQCSPYHANSALYPVIQHLETAAAIKPADSAAEKLAKIESLLTGSGLAPDRALPLVADLLSIPLDGKYPPAPGTPAQRRSALISLLAEWVARNAEHAPLLLVLEDAHWIDATTQELLTRLILAGSTTAALIVVTARPSFAAPWAGRPRVAVIGLDGLTQDDCEKVINSVVAARSLKPPVIAGIIAKCDGNPLYLEELTEAVLISSSTGNVVIPDTLQDSLMARLDAMGDVKETAQVAAVIGRKFSLQLLAIAMGVESGLLDAAMSQLLAAELIHPVGRIGDATYAFRHALVHDAAYQSLLRTRRRALHERIGRALETRFPALAESEPDLLAYHFSQAGLAKQASLYNEQAGDRAAAQFSFTEAIASYRGALTENSLLAASADRDRRELSLLLKLGPALAIILGPRHEEFGELYDRAAAIASALDDLESQFRATWGLWYHANIGRDLESALRRAGDLMALGERSQDDGHQLEALHCRWSSEMFCGDSVTCTADARRGIARYDPARHHALGLIFGGHDPGVCAYGVVGMGSSLSGYPDQGCDMVDKAIVLAESLNHPHSVAHALHTAVIASSIAQDAGRTESLALRLIQISEKYNFLPLLSVGMFFHAVSLNDPEKRLAAMQTEFARVVTVGPMPVLFTAQMAEQLLLAGMAADALPILDKVLAELKIPDTGLYLPEIHRLRGECLARLAPGEPDKALEAIAQSLKISRAQGARSLELRAAMSWLRLSPPQGRRDARAALRQLFDGFTEGFQSDSLMRAKELLAAGE